MLSYPRSATFVAENESSGIDLREYLSIVVQAAIGPCPHNAGYAPSLSEKGKPARHNIGI